MKREFVNEVIECVGDHRRVFYYFKDRYCFDLIDLELHRLGVDCISIAELKSGKMARYLNKPTVSRILGALGRGVLDRQTIPLLGPADRMPFTLGLGCWGRGERGWDQTSRNQSNLVLQLNFDGGHDAAYKRLVKPTDSNGPFELWCHPVSQSRRKTLAWVRMDIDFETDEVLIEEIQNDWLREARSILQWVERKIAKKPSLKPGDIYSDIDCSLEGLRQYVAVALKPYEAIWSEAAMLAAIRFVKDEIGISNIYYHTVDTGKKLKGVGGNPPRSVYTKLPKAFGFELTRQAPELLESNKFSRRCLKAIKAPLWYYLKV